jgi:putative spermidine/putrescine transport system permease protein
LGVPAAYALARRDFPGKRFIILLFLLPILVPPMTYGIPLATVLYQSPFGGTLWGVILANLVPTVPFVILVMIPFIEQIDPRIEQAARVFGAGTGRLFVHVLVPLLLPGILAALLLVLVRTIAMFELTFLTAGPTSQTLVVALYYAVFAAGVRAGPIDRRDGGALHGDDAGLALDRAAVRQSDADRYESQARGGVREARHNE